MSSGIERKNFRSNKISSLYFMAPERILAEIDMTDVKLMAKSDTWSVGILIYLMVFGDFPFNGDNTNKLAK
jgi:serine/threonine protein kinase